MDELFPAKPSVPLAARDDAGAGTSGAVSQPWRSHVVPAPAAPAPVAAPPPTMPQPPARRGTAMPGQQCRRPLQGCSPGPVPVPR